MPRQALLQRSSSGPQMLHLARHPTAIHSYPVTASSVVPFLVRILRSTWSSTVYVTIPKNLCNSALASGFSMLTMVGTLLGSGFTPAGVTQ